MQTKTRLSRPLAAFAFAMTLATFPGQASAATSFDGRWSVQIRAENGNCPASYTLPIRISDGRVSYSGPFNAKASGRIASTGALKVNFVHSEDVVTARGSLKGSTGRGSWKSPTQSCNGTWIARKG